MRKLICILSVLCLATLGMLLSTPASAFFDDFESDTVGQPAVGWSVIWDETHVSNLNVDWGSKYLATNAEWRGEAAVTGLTLGDFVLNVDVVKLPGAGCMDIMTRMAGFNHNDWTCIRVAGGGFTIYNVTVSNWVDCGHAAWNDGQNHDGENAHVRIQAIGQDFQVKLSLISNPSVFADAGVVSIPAAAASGYFGLAIESRPDSTIQTGFDNFSVKAYTQLGELTGHITLEDWNMTNVANTPIKIRFVPTSGGAAMTAYPVQLDPSNGNFNYDVENIQPGTYDLYYSGPNWVEKLVSGVVFTAAGITIQDVTLMNGDLDGDNEVTSTDLSILLKSLNQQGE